MFSWITLTRTGGLRELLKYATSCRSYVFITDMKNNIADSENKTRAKEHHLELSSQIILFIKQSRYRNNLSYKWYSIIFYQSVTINSAFITIS